MQKTKKLLSLLLIMAMMLSCMPISTLAADSDAIVSLTGDYYEVDATGSIVEGTETDDPKQTITDGDTGAYVKMSKTAAATANDNEFEITLNVETMENVAELSIPSAASVVLVLDASDSMDSTIDEIQPSDPGWSLNDTRWTALKNAAARFIEDLLGDGTTNNQVSIVIYGGISYDGDGEEVHKTICDWTSEPIEAIESFNFQVVGPYAAYRIGATDQDSLRYCYFNTASYSNGSTNCQAGFRGAIEQLGDSELIAANAPYVIYMSDGMANCSYSDPGYMYTAADYAIQEAGILKDEYPRCTLYTVGFSWSAEYSTVLRPYDGQYGNPYVDQYFYADDADTLVNIYSSVASSITMFSEAWTVTDPMPDYVTLDVSSIIAETAASCSLGGNNVLTWDLKNCEPSDTYVDKDGNTVYVYTLTYTITVDPTDLEEGEIYPTNLQTTLTYVFADDQGNLPDNLKTADFLVPTVKLADKYNVSYTVTGDTPSTYSTVPATASYYKGVEVTVASSLTTTETTYNGKTGTWTFSGWTTDDATVTGGKFNMPDQAVELTGTWTFTEADKYNVSYTVTGDAPSTYSTVPATASYYEGVEVTVASKLTTTETTYNGKTGTWTFSGWTTDDATVAGGKFNMPGQAVELTGTWTFTEAQVNPVMTVISGKKIWDMSADTTAAKPKSITVYLKDGDRIVETKVVTPDAGGDWNYTFTAPKYRADGVTVIEYTIEEKAIADFKTTIIKTDEGFDIKNTYDGNTSTGTVIIEGQKFWTHLDNPENKRPKSITIIIFANGQQYMSFVVDEESHWRYSFELPKYDVNGNEIVYTVDEERINDYAKKIDGYNIYNSYHPGWNTDLPEPDVPYSPSDPNNSGQPGEAPKTGDNSNILLWVTLISISAAILVVLQVCKSKYKGKYYRR